MPLVADESLPGAAIYQNNRGKSTGGGLLYRRPAAAGRRPGQLESAGAAAGQRQPQGRQNNQRHNPCHTNPVHRACIYETRPELRGGAIPKMHVPGMVWERNRFSDEITPNK
jgi:hypothetical protein